MPRIRRLKAGGKPSTWFPPGGLAERLQANNIDAHRTTQMHRNYNRTQKKQTNTSMTEIIKEPTSEETKKRTKQHASQQMYEQTIAKKNKSKALRYEYGTGIVRADKTCGTKNTNARTTATTLESLTGKTQTDHFKARPHNRTPRTKKTPDD